jgi:hypothetical protein
MRTLLLSAVGCTLLSVGCNATPPSALRSAVTTTIELYVDRDHAGTVEDGTASNPFATIGQAVAVAAADGSTTAYLIHVAPAPLTGPYADELLPIQLARPSLTIAGGTQFTDDADGRPVGIVDGTQTALGGQIRNNQPFFYVTAAHVTVSGLVMAQARTFGVLADGAADFDFSDNDVENTSQYGLGAMHGASGRFTHNLVTSCFAGIVGSGGDGTPHLVVDRNYSHHNHPIGTAFTGNWEYTTQVDLASDGPPQLTPRVAHPAPTSIDVVETNNNISYNDCVGTRFLAVSPVALTFDASTMTSTTSLTARVGGDGPHDGNLFAHNNCPGLNIDGGNGLAIAGFVYSANMAVTSTHNRFFGNGQGQQIVSVGHFGLPFGGINSFNAQFQELRHSLLSLTTDVEANYWNPTHDVYDCTQLLDDTVLVNGASVNGTNVDKTLLCRADR